VEQLIDIFRVGEEHAHALQQLDAICSQSHLSRRSMQQARAHGRFELLDGSGHRRTRQFQCVSGFDETTHLGHLHKYAVLIELIHLEY